MIEVRGITKKYGSKVAVANLSFDVQPGRVTGFLGPNGSGKSTTMRCMLGLDRPDLGTATLLAAMHRAGVRRLVLASSMVVYGEGRYACAEHGLQPAPARHRSDLDAGVFDHLCGVCGAPLSWALVSGANWARRPPCLSSVPAAMRPRPWPLPTIASRR